MIILGLQELSADFLQLETSRVLAPKSKIRTLPSGSLTIRKT